MIRLAPEKERSIKVNTRRRVSERAKARSDPAARRRSSRRPGANGGAGDDVGLDALLRQLPKHADIGPAPRRTGNHRQPDQGLSPRALPAFVAIGRHGERRRPSGADVFTFVSSFASLHDGSVCASQERCIVDFRLVVSL